MALNQPTTGRGAPFEKVNERDRHAHVVTVDAETDEGAGTLFIDLCIPMSEINSGSQRETLFAKGTSLRCKTNEALPSVILPLSASIFSGQTD